MLQIIAIVFDAAEGDAAESVDLEDELGAGWGGADVDVGFFADADAVACAVEGGAFEVGVEGEVVESAVGEAVSVIWGLIVSVVIGKWVGVGGTFCIFHSSDQVRFCEGGDGFVDSASAS